MSSSSIGYSSGGIDVADMVSQLMKVERQPIDAIKKRQATAQLQTDAVGRLRTNLESLKTTASSLLSGGFSKFAASVSNTSAVSASVSTGAAAGSVSFTVDQLAAAHGLRTGTSVGSSTSVVTADALLAVSSTTSAIGATKVAVGAGVTAGSYTATVTQATTGARRTGTTTIAASTTFATAQTLGYEVGGVAKSISISAGTYTPTTLAAAIQTQIDGQGGGVTAAIDGSGRLQLTTTREGSAASLRITNANTSFGLSVDATAVTGTDGKIKIGTNPEVTVTSAGTSTSSVAVSTGTGNLTLDLTKGLRIGSASIGVVSTGDKSLGAVAAAINSSKMGVTAAAVKVSEGNWMLQVNSSSSGTSNMVALDASAFSTVGGLVQTAAAQDAKITVGSGAGAYSISASGNTFTDVLPGVSITASAVTTAPVNVSVNRDTGAIADAMDGFVGAVNKVLAEIAMQTKFDAAKKVASPLTGDPTVKRLSDQVRSAVMEVVGGLTTKVASQVGLTTNRTGTIDFDRAAFINAIDADPAAVERLFGRGGSGSSGSVTFANAADATAAGAYSVVVTTAATRATTGTLLAGAVGGRQIAVRVGSTTATYNAAVGASATDVVAGLNSAMATAGLKINASVSGGGISLTAVDFGVGGSFDVNTDAAGAGSYVSYAGTDVAGTIDGQSAVGVGQRLRLLPLDTSSAKGLELDVAEGATGALGTFTYSPGAAARTLAMAAGALADKGAIATSKNGYDVRIKGFQDQIDRFELRMTMKEASLKRQWSSVQSLLTGFQSQGSWLSQQLAKK